MKTITVEQAERSFGSVLEELERDGEEVSLVRDDQTVARLVPEPHGQNAFEIFEDIAGCLEKDAADALARGISVLRESEPNRLNTLKNPWVS